MEGQVECMVGSLNPINLHCQNQPFISIVCMHTHIQARVSTHARRQTHTPTHSGTTFIH